MIGSAAAVLLGSTICVRVLERSRVQPEANILDRAFVGTDADVVAHLERMIEHHHEGAEKIRDRVLGGKGDGQAADAHACEDRAHIHPEALDSHQHAEDDHQRSQRFLDQRHEMRDPDLLFVRNLFQMVEQGAAGPQQAPEQHRKNRDGCAMIDEPVDPGRELQHGQGGKDAQHHDKGGRRLLQRREQLVVERRLGPFGQLLQAPEDYACHDTPQQNGGDEEDATGDPMHEIAVRTIRENLRLEPVDKMLQHVVRRLHRVGGTRRKSGAGARQGNGQRGTLRKLHVMEWPLENISAPVVKAHY